jgi:protein-L-isoaspartate(D-aspartate) O-methyltransferase
MATFGKARELASDTFTGMREEMLETQIRRRGLTDEGVLRAMACVPRHEFLPLEVQSRSYEDVPLPIGGGQTISQPYIVAIMTAGLHLDATKKVLEIGTGCGYQAAVLSLMSGEVHSVEYRTDLAVAADQRLKRLGYSNVRIHCGDGSDGLPKFAPYDAILVAAAAPAVPPPLLDQLGDGGRMIVPIGTEDLQELVLVTRHGREYSFEQRGPCRFVPLLGRHGWKEWEFL